MLGDGSITGDLKSRGQSGESQWSAISRMFEGTPANIGQNLELVGTKIFHPIFHIY